MMLDTLSRSIDCIFILMASLEAICKPVLMKLWSETAHMVGEFGGACTACRM